MKDIRTTDGAEIANARYEAARLSRDIHMLPLSQWKLPPSADTMRRYNDLRNSVRRVLPVAEDAWPPEVDEQSLPQGFAHFDIAFYVDFILRHLGDDRRLWR